MLLGNHLVCHRVSFDLLRGLQNHDRNIHSVQLRSQQLVHENTCHLYIAVGGDSVDSITLKHSSMNLATAGTNPGGPTKKVRDTS
jgi:hypothetical protein